MRLINNSEIEVFLQKRFFTFLDMLKLDLRALTQLYEFLSQHDSIYSEELKPKDMNEFSNKMAFFLETMEEEFAKLNMSMTKKQFDRLKELADKLRKIPDTEMPPKHFTRDFGIVVKGMKNVFEDELTLQIAYRINPEYHKFLENAFSKEAKNQFIELAYDMEEACKCIVFERFTATAYHLMRICEGAVKELTGSLGIEYKKQSNWSDIIKKLKGYADSLPKEQMDEANELREIIISVELVKDAWRNRIMHLEEKYNPEEVLKIFDSTDRLITEIAKKLTKE